MENNVKISPYSKLKVYWDDRPENYSKEGKNKIRNHFSYSAFLLNFASIRVSLEKFIVDVSAILEAKLKYLTKRLLF